MDLEYVAILTAQLQNGNCFFEVRIISKYLEKYEQIGTATVILQKNGKINYYKCCAPEDYEVSEKAIIWECRSILISLRKTTQCTDSRNKIYG